MARTKRKTKVRPKTPSRIKKRRPKTARPRSFRHPELWGLGLVALGIFLGSIVYAGWNGGYVGGALADGFRALIGGATYVVPVTFTVVGALMVVRSALVDVRPFRAGLIVVTAGLMIALGRDQGGYLGQMLGGAVGIAIGATGSTILGILLLLIGALLLSGASLGAILRSSGHQVRQRVKRPEWPRPEPVRELETWDDPVAQPVPMKPKPKPVDAEQAYPDVLAPSPLLSTEPAPLVTQQEQLFEDMASEHAEYKLPDRSVLNVSQAKDGDTGETSARVAELLVQTLAHFGIDANVVGQISG